MSTKLVNKDGKGKVIHLNRITDMDMNTDQILQAAKKWGWMGLL